MKVYYAHPINNYNTDAERAVVTWLEAAHFVVCNPNMQGVPEAYKRDGFQVFYDLIAGCDALVYETFPDGAVGAGVDKERKYALMRGMPVLKLPPFTERVLSVEETRARVYGG